MSDGKFVWNLDLAMRHAHPSIIGVANPVWIDEIRRSQRTHDDAIRELLAVWVSELEPTVHVSYSGDVLGLGYAGDTDRTIVVAK